MSDHNLAGPYLPRRSEEILEWWANLPDPGTPHFEKGTKRLCELYPEIFSEFNDLATLGAEGGQTPREGDFLKAVWRIREHLRAIWDAPDARSREWYIFKLREFKKGTADTLREQRLQDLYLHLRSRGVMDEQARRDLENYTAELHEHMESTGITTNVQVPRFASSRDSESGLSDLERLHRRLAELNHFWNVKIEPAPPLTHFEQIMFHFQRAADRVRHCANPECPAPYFFVKKKGQRYCTGDCAIHGQREAKNKWWANKGKEWRDKRHDKKASIKKGAAN